LKFFPGTVPETCPEYYPKLVRFSSARAKSKFLCPDPYELHRTRAMAALLDLQSATGIDVLFDRLAFGPWLN
jgi:hypothetical protein